MLLKLIAYLLRGNGHKKRGDRFRDFSDEELNVLLVALRDYKEICEIYSIDNGYRDPWLAQELREQAFSAMFSYERRDTEG